jgi:hypothetical protein
MSEPHPERQGGFTIERSLIQARIAALDAERAAGLKLLGELESRVSTLRGQLLRIDGARQALQELLAPSEGPDADAAPQARACADLGPGPGPGPG